MKLIAVSQRIDFIATRGEIRDALDQRLIQFIEECGYLSIPVPNSTKCLNEWMEKIKPDGIILSGGNNIGEYRSRDQVERYLIKYAKERKQPLLGICRGFQMLANEHGAKLYKVDNHVAIRHTVFGEIDKEVNSYHEYAIRECPEGFQITSRAIDGAIESIEHKSLPWEAWMWHPEREIQFNNDDKIRVQNLFK